MASAQNPNVSVWLELTVRAASSPLPEYPQLRTSHQKYPIRLGWRQRFSIWCNRLRLDRHDHVVVVRGSFSEEGQSHRSSPDAVIRRGQDQRAGGLREIGARGSSWAKKRRLRSTMAIETFLGGTAAVAAPMGRVPRSPIEVAIPPLQRRCRGMSATVAER